MTNDPFSPDFDPDAEAESPKVNGSYPKTLDLKNPVIVMHPPQILEFQKALNANPFLAETLQASCNTFEDVIATLAAKYGIILNDSYSGDDVLRLLEILTARLRNEDTPSIVLATDTDAKLN